MKSQPENHPYNKLNFYVRECTCCHKAQITESGYGWHDIPDAATARFIERQAQKKDGSPC